MGFRRWAISVAWLVASATATVAAEVACPTAVGRPPVPLAFVGESPVLRLRAAELGTFHIVVDAGPGLLAEPAALAALERAARRWEAVLADPVAVTLNVDLQDLGEDGPLGWASSSVLSISYGGLRERLLADADADDDVVSLLPAPEALGVLLPLGHVASGTVLGTKAAFKAAGFDDLDKRFPDPDAVIRLNARFPFDFDAGDGVAPDLFDLESVMVHEIGHTLGFLSAVDALDSDGASEEVALQVLDLFRFQDQRASDPETPADFQLFPRSVVPGAPAIFDDLAFEGPMSTGRIMGDGRQASHWKDDRLTGVHIGVMDPTLRAGESVPITGADLRALDAIGWDLVGVDPRTSTSTSSTTSTTSTTTSNTTGTTASTTTSTTVVGIQSPACDRETSTSAGVRCLVDLLEHALRDAPADAFRTRMVRRQLSGVLDTVVTQAERLDVRGMKPSRVHAVRKALRGFMQRLHRLGHRERIDGALAAHLASLAADALDRLGP